MCRKINQNENGEPIHNMINILTLQAFHNVCYNAQEKRDLLHGINEFLGDVSSTCDCIFKEKSTNCLPFSQLSCHLEIGTRHICCTWER